MNPHRTKPIPMLIVAAFAVLLSGLLAAAAVTGAMRPASSQSGVAADVARPGTPQQVVVAAAYGRTRFTDIYTPARSPECANCGVVESIRPIEISMQKRIAYRVTVRMDDGSYRTVSQRTLPDQAAGDRVRVAEGATLEGAALGHAEG